jgi:hypothetical protein
MGMGDSNLGIAIPGSCRGNREASEFLFESDDT